MKTPITRRQFLHRSGSVALSLGPALGARALAQTPGANERIGLGLIGCGGMGRVNLKSFMQLQGVAIAAVCDVDAQRLEATVKEVSSAGRPAPARFADFRRLLELKEVDAVIVATPDHWHALPFIAACEAGKDVYCEAPLSHSLAECKAMLAAAAHFQRVIQVGLWQRSVRHFQQAIEFVRAGQLGQISVCRAWCVSPLEGWLKSIGHQEPVTPPAHLDWETWLGPAPKTPYHPNRCHYSWRWFFDYGGGLMTDWGVHLLDTILQGMGESDPMSVAAIGGRFVLDDDRDTPDTMQTVYRFPKWLLHWEARLANGRGLEGGRSHGLAFLGTKGTLLVDREGHQWFPESPEHKGPPKPERSENTHWQNFLDCVKSRQTPRADLESAARATTICHLGNIALQCGRTIYWDGRQQDIANRAEARVSPAYERTYRAPWKLKHWKSSTGQ
jgi:predicted dehydrogenase